MVFQLGNMAKAKTRKAIQMKATKPANAPKTKKTQRLEAFNFFPKLPPELRLNIYGMLLPQPRIVKITNPDGKTRRVQNRLGYSPDHYYTFVVAAKMEIPVLLHICQESKWFAQKFYKPLFESQIGHCIYLDPAVDTLYLEDRDVAIGLYGSPWNFHKFSDALEFEAHEMSTVEDTIKHLILGDNWTRGDACFHNNPSIPLFPKLGKFKKIRSVALIRMRWNPRVSAETQEHFERNWIAEGSQLPAPILKAIDESDLNLEPPQVSPFKLACLRVAS
jgi:hypothetical protein